jgi:hypothetical protein
VETAGEKGGFERRRTKPASTSGQVAHPFDLGKAASELVPPDDPPITMEKVKRLESELE